MPRLRSAAERHLKWDVGAQQDVCICYKWSLLPSAGRAPSAAAPARRLGMPLLSVAGLASREQKGEGLRLIRKGVKVIYSARLVPSRFNHQARPEAGVGLRGKMRRWTCTYARRVWV